MLYQLYDLRQAALTPLRLAAQATQTAFQNPFMPASYTRMGRRIAAGAELVERTTRRYGKPAFGLDTTSIDGRTVAVQERASLVKPFCTLLHFQRDTERRDPKILLVAPLSGHFATLLRGTVEALLPEHDVYITDWTDARQVPLARGAFGLDDYVAYVMDFVRHLGPDTHVMAVCQPTVPVLAAMSVMSAHDDPGLPRSMILMGGPIDPGAAPTTPTKLAESRPLEWFERTVVQTVPVYYPGGLRRVYPGFIQLTGFMTMNLERHLDAHMKLFDHLVVGDGDSADKHREFYDEYLSVLDLPAEFYLDTISRVFQRHDLPNGTLTWRGEKVDPGAITKVALMTVEGELDDISAPGQTIAAHRLCRNLPSHMHLDHMQPAVGHYGIFNGRKWREHVLPRVRDFIRKWEA
ncbi:MAG TPA: polyhydroxyalkanoate depolymerase [Azospirillaceae bacterium]|nr:polyhydroxyalkanoate depolymerase [Azospirillaceae bacterium]